MLSQCLSWSPAERSQEQRLQKKQKEDVINMANKLAFNSIFGFFGLFSLILLIQFVNGTEEQQLWATTLKEKALGMEYLALSSFERIFLHEGMYKHLRKEY